MIPSRSPLQKVCAVALLGIALAACNQTAATPPAPPPAAVAGLPSSSASGCSGDIAQFKAVLKNDVDTGNVGQSVYNRANADLGRAESACAAGRDGEARSLVASTKSRFGYR
jgi:curli biogenesis system outer membrane secretion channel CsgG